MNSKCQTGTNSSSTTTLEIIKSKLFTITKNINPINNPTHLRRNVIKKEKVIGTDIREMGNTINSMISAKRTRNNSDRVWNNTNRKRISIKHLMSININPNIKTLSKMFRKFLKLINKSHNSKTISSLKGNKNQRRKPL